MKSARPRQLFLWFALAVLPVVTGFVAMGLIPEGVQRVPLHWDFSGNINGWGEPSELLTLGSLWRASMC